jgi:hypothetical protein
VARRPDDQRIKIEKLGGFAGFGSSAHLRSEGEVELEKLAEPDRVKVAGLLARDTKDHPSSLSQFVYRLTWEDRGETKSVDVGEDELPQSVIAAVKDELI